MNHCPDKDDQDENPREPMVSREMPEQPPGSSHLRWFCTQSLAVHRGCGRTVGAVEERSISVDESGHINRQAARVFTYWHTGLIMMSQAFQTLLASTPEEASLMLRPGDVHGSSVVLSPLDRIAHWKD